MKVKNYNPKETGHFSKRCVLKMLEQAYALDRNEWQLCPKCNGSGKYYYQQMGSQTTACKFGFHQCDLCNGAMVIAKPQPTDLLNK